MGRRKGVREGVRDVCGCPSYARSHDILKKDIDRINFNTGTRQALENIIAEVLEI